MAGESHSVCVTCVMRVFYQSCSQHGQPLIQIPGLPSPRRHGDLTKWCRHQDPHQFSKTTLCSSPLSTRTVLELGSGVGLTGVAICLSCRPSRYVFTDCHPNVLQRLKANVRLNGLMEGTTPGVSVEELDWTEATEEQLQQIGADVVIAAGLSCTRPNSPSRALTSL